MKRPVFVAIFVVFVGLFLAINLCTPTWGAVENKPPARPGSVNYVEGQAAIDGVVLNANSPGNVELERGQTLTTQAGKVEILLTPGVFLRIADNSSVKMISPELANTEVSVEKGRAMVEALDVRKENYIRIDQNDANTRILKNGLYDFDANNCEVRVLKGAAEVTANDQKIKLGGEHEVALDTAGKLKARGFDTRPYEDESFRWSALRSGYLSEAAADEARVYVGVGPGWYGPGWYGPGWYWNPWFGAWTFLPAEGIYYSPFGWRFYSPILIYHSPRFYYWGHQPHRFGEFHEPYGHGFEPQGGFHGGGFRGSAGPGGVPHGAGHR